jgi:hypothetical protein
MSNPSEVSEDFRQGTASAVPEMGREETGFSR